MAGGVAFWAVWLAVSLPLQAQDGASPPAGRAGELREVTDKIKRGEAELARLRSEITGLKGDRAKLNSELIRTAEAVRQAEERVSQSQGRLSEISASERALRGSLEARRATLAEVLAVLQRMGRKPPPAVIVRPEDMIGPK